MAKQLLDRFTALGIGGKREKEYDRATAPELVSSSIDEYGTRDIALGLKPNLDSFPIPMIETITDADVLNRPWDAPSEIQQVSNMVKVDLTWPRLTLNEAMAMIVLAMSNHTETISGGDTYVTATPKNDASDIDLYSTCLTVNAYKGDGPDTDFTNYRYKDDYGAQAATFNPGLVRAYDGFFINSFELTLERGTERLFQLTIDGYASGSYGESAVWEDTVNTDFYQNNYVGKQINDLGTIASTNFRNSYVDSRSVHPTGRYLRGTDTRAYLAFTANNDASLADLTAANTRRLTSGAVGDRSVSIGTENLLPTGGNVDGPALIDLTNIAYSFSLSYNNNVDIEDLLRWGGGNRITAAEKQAASIEVGMEFNLGDYSYFSKLINDYNMALQLVCSPDANTGMGLLFPLVRQSENTVSRRGIKRTQQITLMPMGVEAGTAPMYADFRVDEADLQEGTLFEEDGSNTLSTETQ